MTAPQIDTAVALLRARDDTIAAQKITIEEQRITIRHLKHLLAEQDEELLQRERLYGEALLDGLE